MNAKHTQTPWTYYDITDGKKQKYSIVHNGPIAYVGNAGNDEAEANVQHIVKCVNMHDDLISMLRMSKMTILSGKCIERTMAGIDKLLKENGG